MRLYSTLHRDLVELPADGARSACTSAARPSTSARTSATRGRTSSSRGSRAGSAIQGREVTLVHNITDVNDKIYAAAPGRSAERAAEATGWYLEDVGRFGLDEVDHFPKVTETMDEIVAFIADLVERGLRLRGRGATSTSASRAGRSTAGSRASGRTRCRTRRRSRTRARTTRATSRSGRRRSPARTHPGTRPGAAAGRAGTSSARRWRSSCSAPSSRSTAAGSTSSSRTTRTSSRSRVRGATRSRALDAQRDAALHRREDVEVARQRRDDPGGARPLGARDAARLLPDRALAEADRLLGGDAGRGRAGRRALPRGLPQPVRAGAGGRLGAVRRGARGRLQHPGGARGPARVARSRPAAAAWASSASARSPRSRRRRPRSSRWPSSGQARRERRDFDEADRLRDEIEAAGWEVRDVARRGFRLVRRAA